MSPVHARGNEIEDNETASKKRNDIVGLIEPAAITIDNVLARRSVGYYFAISIYSRAGYDCRVLHDTLSPITPARTRAHRRRGRPPSIVVIICLLLRPIAASIRRRASIAPTIATRKALYASTRSDATNNDTRGYHFTIHFTKIIT